MELYHHGIKGQKWGVRRYQNEDGSLTPEGIKRYGINENGEFSNRGIKKIYKDVKKEFNSNRLSPYNAIVGKQSKSFGKNTDYIVKKYKKEALDNDYERELNKIDKEAKELNKELSKNSLTDSEKINKISEFNKKYTEKYRELQINNTIYGKKIAEKYINEFDKALLKDLNVPNIEQVNSYMLKNKPIWDTTYISNYTWFKQLF